ncbi:hypothetical protein KM043_000070, partial [Ampulex compressa]
MAKGWETGRRGRKWKRRCERQRRKKDAMELAAVDCERKGEAKAQKGRRG